MNPAVIKQTTEIINNHQVFAIILKEQWTIDDFSAGVAWQIYLKSKNKNSVIYCSGKKPEKQLDFLGEINFNDHLLGKKYQIEVDVSQSGVNELSYSVENNILKILITPDKGLITEKDIRLQSADSNIDALICIGMNEQTTAGKIFTDQANVFYSLPIINIDFQPENIRYGTVNIIDVTTCSNCEISYDLFSTIENSTISSEVATALLAGLIDSTQSFLRGKVSPKSFKIAGQLLELGAKREKVVGHLYQTKTVDQLRLWGEALKNIEERANGKLLLTQVDNLNKDIEIEKISGIVNELLINNPTTKVACLIIKHNDESFSLLMDTNKSYDLTNIIKNDNIKSVIKIDSKQELQTLLDKISTYLEQI